MNTKAIITGALATVAGIILWDIIGPKVRPFYQSAVATTK